MSLKKLLAKKLEKIKPEKEDGCGEICSPYESYPTLYLNHEELPEIKEWEVDGEYYLVMKVKQTGKSMRTDKDGEENWHGDFQIKEIGVIEDKDVPKNKKDNPKDSIKEKYDG